MAASSGSGSGSASGPPTSATRDPGSVRRGGLNPGDEVAPGTPQSGEAVCPECKGTGRIPGAGDCSNCGGSGKVTQLVGDA
jgi:DnaJ-class molecular chaperone